MSKPEKPKPKCPTCNEELRVMLLLGHVPDFYVCDRCSVAFDLEDMKPLAAVIQ